MKIIICSAPPYAGKDLFCRHLFEEYNDHYNISHMGFERFSYPLKAAFCAVSRTTMSKYHENNVYENNKDEIVPLLGVSHRQFQIDFSEKFLKPLYGKDIFGKILLRNLLTYPKDSVVVIPDGGFKTEIQILENNFKTNEVLIVRIHRKDTDFSKDSRDWIYSDKFMSINITNNSSIEDFKSKANSIFKAFLGGEDLNSFNERV